MTNCAEGTLLQWYCTISVWKWLVIQDLYHSRSIDIFSPFLDYINKQKQILKSCLFEAWRHFKRLVIFGLTRAPNFHPTKHIHMHIRSPTSNYGLGSSTSPPVLLVAHMQTIAIESPLKFSACTKYSCLTAGPIYLVPYCRLQQA